MNLGHSSSPLDTGVVRPFIGWHWRVLAGLDVDPPKITLEIIWSLELALFLAAILTRIERTPADAVTAMPPAVLVVRDDHVLFPAAPKTPRVVVQKGDARAALELHVLETLDARIIPFDVPCRIASICGGCLCRSLRGRPGVFISLCVRATTAWLDFACIRLNRWTIRRLPAFIGEAQTTAAMVIISIAAARIGLVLEVV